MIDLQMGEVKFDQCLKVVVNRQMLVFYLL